MKTIITIDAKDALRKARKVERCAKALTKAIEELREVELGVKSETDGRWQHQVRERVLGCQSEKMRS